MLSITRILTSLALAVVAAFSWLEIAAAQSPAPNWPTRPVRFIVPLGPGSGVDVTARLIADRLSQKWGQPVVVENRPGGDSIVAITAVINANDDHMLLMAPASSFTAHPYLHDSLPYKFTDLTPITRVSNTIVVFAVPAALNVNSLKELVAKAKELPGKMNWATATGANDLMYAGWLKTAGLDMAKVPYKNTVDAVSDLAENRIQGYVAAYTIVRPRVQEGKVKILALSNSKRVASLPNIPTATEEGYPELTLDGLVGLLGPKNIAPNIREKIAADVATVMNDQEVITKLTSTGQVVSPGSPKEFTDEINGQRDAVAKIGDSLGMKKAAEK
jgi:tripartite-type tricarboxylate transporter receptor subunit TctC